MIFFLTRISPITRIKGIVICLIRVIGEIRVREIIKLKIHKWLCNLYLIQS